MLGDVGTDTEFEVLLLKKNLTPLNVLKFKLIIRQRKHLLSGILLIVSSVKAAGASQDNKS